MKIIFLGTASSKPSPDRNPSCIALLRLREVILFDCGEGCQRQMLRNVKQSRIKRIFITHFHGDHYLGLPGLLMTMSLNGREDPIEIYGPEGTREFIKNMLISGYMDISYDILVTEIGDDLIDFNGYSIRSFPVDHGIPALGFVFIENDRRGNFDREKARKLGIKGKMFAKLEKDGELIINGKTVKIDDLTGITKKGKKITYSGDTRPIQFPMETKGSNVLIHEATFMNPEERGDTFHSTVREACESAVSMGAGLLVITHINSRYDKEAIEEEANRYFNGAVVAYDLFEIEI